MARKDAIGSAGNRAVKRFPGENHKAGFFEAIMASRLLKAGFEPDRGLAQYLIRHDGEYIGAIMAFGARLHLWVWGEATVSLLGEILRALETHARIELYSQKTLMLTLPVRAGETVKPKNIKGVM